MNKCVCKDKDKEFDWKHKVCKCPDGKKWDGHRCVKDCGRDADFDWKRGKCVCKDKDKEFDDKTKQCKCPWGKGWDDRSHGCKKLHH